MLNRTVKILTGLWHSWAPSIPIPRTVHGLKIYYDLRDNPAYIATSRSQLESMPEFEVLAQERESTRGGGVWDVGCNVGVVSVYAASLGYEVFAFDISSKALRYVTRSAHANRLRVTTMEGAFSTRVFHYVPPQSASSANRVQTDGCVKRARSITFLEAAERFGVPRFIKMDIEGGEIEFIESGEFRDWIFRHKITWLVELHNLSFVETVKRLWKDSQLRIITGTDCELYPMVLIR